MQTLINLCRPTFGARTITSFVSATWSKTTLWASAPSLAPSRWQVRVKELAAFLNTLIALVASLTTDSSPQTTDAATPRDNPFCRWGRKRSRAFHRKGPQRHEPVAPPDGSDGRAERGAPYFHFKPSSRSTRSHHASASSRHASASSRHARSLRRALVRSRHARSLRRALVRSRHVCSHTAANLKT